MGIVEGRIKVIDKKLSEMNLPNINLKEVFKNALFFILIHKDKAILVVTEYVEDEVYAYIITHKQNGKESGPFTFLAKRNYGNYRVSPIAFTKSFLQEAIEYNIWDLSKVLRKDDSEYFAIKNLIQ